ncbi:chromosome transmission fidelity protein 4 [Clonorchis sinensis]|uniref:Chromosome transmission fidelity protein 4 n=1 Tax=Clonorchis sinensis TaxID=79923 RepID=H2KQK4_CLOSI|nr:chromosome transmission fidelity protein 4 [Clonorchis sinensis]
MDLLESKRFVFASQLSRHIVSAGADGRVKVLNDVDDASPMEHVIGEKVNSLVCRGDTVILAAEGTYVHVIQVEDGLPEGVATRFTSEVNHAVLNKDGSRLAVCSSDFLIKVVNFSSSDEREFILKGHTGGVLSVAFDPLDILLASASCDGTVRIWKVDEKREIKSLRCLSPSNDPAFALSLCRLCWEHSTGKFLAVPVDKEICLYERDTWEILSYLSCPALAGAVIVCASSFDGSLLAGGTEDGWTVVWRIQDRHALFRLRDPSESAICSLAWHPQQDSVILCANRNGSIGLIRLPESRVSFTKDGDADELLRAAAAQAESSRLVDEIEAAKLLELPDSDDDGDSIDLSRIKSGYLGLDDDDDADEPVKAEQVAPLQPADQPGTEAGMIPTFTQNLGQRIQRPFQPGSMPLGFRERFMVWNRFGLVVQYRGASGDDDEDEDDQDADAVLGGSIEVEFHDTSVHHSLRLSNRVGYTMADLSLTALLLASPGSNDRNLADDFDAGVQIDPEDLSQIAVLPLETAGGGGDTSSSEWTIKLPAGEACDAVCLVPHEDPDERGYAVVATSKRFIRVFSQPSPSTSLLRPSAGLHLFQLTKLGLPPLSISGCGVVALASHPSRPILGVVTSTVVGELTWRLFYLGGTMLGAERSPAPVWLNGVLSTWQTLPLSPAPSNSPSSSGCSSARLTWFGFSDLGGLYTHDASGTVRRLVHGRSPNCPEYHWIPVCDTHSALKPSNRHSDTYFLVGVMESTESMSAQTLESEAPADAGFGQLQTIYCKASKWPRVFPRPVVSNLSFRLPLCSIGTDQGNLEETYLRYLISEDWPVWGPNPRLASLGTVDVDEPELLQTVSAKCLTKRKGILLRLFALAAKLESDWASLAIARLMPDAATVQLAIRYAGRLRRQHLAQRLAGIALEKERAAIPVVDSHSSDGEEEPVYDSRMRCNKYVSDAHPVESYNVRPVGRTGRRHPCGAHDEQDLSNVSLVSSATDDTQDEGHLSGLPLPDSEPLTQSMLSSNTLSSVTARNPFRETKSSGGKQSSNGSSVSTPRGRGSEILDSWKPHTTSNSNSDTQRSSHPKAASRSGKKRAAPGLTNEKKPQHKESLGTTEESLKFRVLVMYTTLSTTYYKTYCSTSHLWNKTTRMPLSTIKVKSLTSRVDSEDSLDEKENEPIPTTCNDVKVMAPAAQSSNQGSRKIHRHRVAQTITQAVHLSPVFSLFLINQTKTVEIKVHGKWIGTLSRPNIFSIGLGSWTTQSELVNFLEFECISRTMYNLGSRKTLAGWKHEDRVHLMSPNQEKLVVGYRKVSSNLRSSVPSKTLLCTLIEIRATFPGGMDDFSKQISPICLMLLFVVTECKRNQQRRIKQELRTRVTPFGPVCLGQLFYMECFTTEKNVDNTDNIAGRLFADWARELAAPAEQKDDQLRGVRNNRITNAAVQRVCRVSALDFTLKTASVVFDFSFLPNSLRKMLDKRQWE